MGLQIKNTRGGSGSESGKQGAVTVWKVCPVFGIRHCVLQTQKLELESPEPCPGCHSMLFPPNNFQSRLAQAHSLCRRCRVSHVLCIYGGAAAQCEQRPGPFCTEGAWAWQANSKLKDSTDLPGEKQTDSSLLWRKSCWLKQYSKCTVF